MGRGEEEQQEEDDDDEEGLLLFAVAPLVPKFLPQRFPRQRWPRSTGCSGFFILAAPAASSDATALLGEPGAAAGAVPEELLCKAGCGTGLGGS